MSVHKTVFPDEIAEDESLRDVITKLNSFYLAQTSPEATAASTSSSGGGFFSGWGLKKNPTLSRVRIASSSSELPSSGADADGDASAGGRGDVAQSAPGSRGPSRHNSATDLTAGVQRMQVGRVNTTAFMETDDDDFPAPLWAADPLTTLIVSGAALGSGMFGLIFSSEPDFPPDVPLTLRSTNSFAVMPPKMRKMISWFGFTSSSRSASLKLLKVAASSASPPSHSQFAS